MALRASAFARELAGVVRDDEADPARFLIGLSRARVRWLLIGRQALIHYGVPVQTMDYDLWVDPVPANVGKLLRVARESGLEAPESAKELESKPLFSLFGGTLKIDVFKVRRFTNLDGETIEFARPIDRRVIARAEGRPAGPAAPLDPRSEDAQADARRRERSRGPSLPRALGTWPEATQEMTRGCSVRRESLATPLIFLCALVVRLLYLRQAAGVPFSSHPIVDGARYWSWAERIAAGDWRGMGVFYQAPLYPYVLAVVRDVFGPSLTAVYLVQATLSWVGCALLCLAGRRLFSPWAGIAAGLMAALYAPSVFFDGVLQKEALAVFLMSVLIWLIAVSMADRRPGLGGAMGLVLVLLALLRENTLLLAPLLPVWMWTRARGGRASRPWLGPACFIVGMAAVLLPVGVRNLVVGGEFALTTSQLGSNFYLGNNPNADGSYVRATARAWRPGVRAARRHRAGGARLRAAADACRGVALLAGLVVAVHPLGTVGLDPVDGAQDAAVLQRPRGDGRRRPVLLSALVLAAFGTGPRVEFRHVVPPGRRGSVPHLAAGAASCGGCTRWCC